MTEPLIFLSGLALGLALHVWASWRLAKRTGVPLLDVLRGKPGEERKQVQRGKPGEE